MPKIALLLVPLVASACAASGPHRSTTPAANANGAAEMMPIGSDVLADPSTTLDERARLQLDYTAANERIEAALGRRQVEPPLAIFCKSDRCKVHFAGPSRRSWTLLPGDRVPGATYVAGSRLTVVIMRVDPGARDVLAHEMVHAELSHRLRRASIPQWFHEGIASIIAGAPACPAPLPPGVDDLRRLDRNDAWAEYTNQRGVLDSTYCQARAEVAAWRARFGAARVVALVDAVRDGAAFYDLYGPMLTQASSAMPAVVMSPATELGDGRRPFSLAMWIKPAAHAGVLAHGSFTTTGVGGWCTPFLGYDAAHRIVAQVLHGNGPDSSNYAVAANPGPLPLGEWIHVAMTWAPGSSNRLYINGRRAAETAAPRFNAGGAESPRYITWGSSNIGGAACWQGAIAGGRFQGAMTGMRVYPVELGADEIARLATAGP